MQMEDNVEENKLNVENNQSSFHMPSLLLVKKLLSDHSSDTSSQHSNG